MRLLPSVLRRPRVRLLASYVGIFAVSVTGVVVYLMLYRLY